MYYQLSYNFSLQKKKFQLAARCRFVSFQWHPPRYANGGAVSLVKRGPYEGAPIHVASNYTFLLVGRGQRGTLSRESVHIGPRISREASYAYACDRCVYGKHR